MLQDCIHKCINSSLLYFHTALFIVAVVRSSGIFYPQKSENKNAPSDDGNGKDFLSHRTSNLYRVTIQESFAIISNLDLFVTDLCRSCCKLKKKIHFHCEICNQAFTDKGKLQLHELRHKNMTVETTPERKISHPLLDLLKPNEIKDEVLDMSPKRMSPSHPILSANLTNNTAEPEDLSKKVESATVPSSSSEPDVENSALDPNVVNFLHFQRLQLFFQNYYQQLMGQQMLMHPNQPLPEMPSGIPYPTDPALHNALLDMKNTKRPLVESEGQDLLQNFKKIKLEKMYDNRNDLGKPLNGIDQPIINPALMEYPPNFPMLPNFLKQELPPMPVRMPCSTKQNRIFKDEPVPKGYLKFKFNEDCNFMNCGYRNHQSHFHCIR